MSDVEAGATNAVGKGRGAGFTPRVLSRDTNSLETEKPQRLSASKVAALFRAWQGLHRYASSVTRKWQKLEGQLVKEIGFPHVSSGSCGSRERVKAFSHRQIDELFCEHAQLPTLHRELDERLAQWETAQKTVGLDDISREELQAWGREHAAEEALFRAQANSMSDVEVKLAVLVKLSITGSSDPEFPWPQIRFLFRDIRRIRGRHA